MSATRSRVRASRVRPFVFVLLPFACGAATLAAQELPPSGVNGIDLVYATDPAGTTSQLYVIDAAAGSATPLGAALSGVPSRWAHRRRTLGAHEPLIAMAEPLIFLTALGDAVGNGGIHFVDARTGTLLADAVIAGGNPPAYDLALHEPLSMVFSAEDDGAGGTTLRGYTYATPGLLLPLSPATLTLPGAPSAYVNRIAVDGDSATLHVPTATGIQLVTLSASAPQMSLSTFVPASGAAPTTNPIAFERADGRIFVCGSSAFSLAGDPNDAGFLAWSADGSTSWSGSFGLIPGRFPLRAWAPAVGTEELALVSDGTDAYAYYLLRDPDPTSLFIRESAVGVVRFVGTAAPVVSKLLCPPEMGEPFSIATVHGARVAMESSMGPPWFATPPGGAEKISIVYSPLDPLGSATADGVLAVAGPLGGRISTKGMDRPLWSRDGGGVYAATSHFPGAPNPGTPGLEFLAVPANVVVDGSSLPVTVVDNPTFPNQSILLCSDFRPADPIAAAALAPFSFVGTVFHDGMGAAMSWPKKKKTQLLGQKQLRTPHFVQSPWIPDFPAIFPPSFDDATGSLVPVPANFGARRTIFDLHSAYGLVGLTQVMALGDTIFVQPSGLNFLAELGLAVAEDPLEIALPAGFITTSEIRSL